MGQAVIDGTFEYVGQTSQVWYADKGLQAWHSFKNTAGGGTIVYESLPTGVASKENDTWTTVTTYSADQAPTSVTETAGLKYRLRYTVAGTKGPAYRVQHGLAADQDSVKS